MIITALIVQMVYQRKQFLQAVQVLQIRGGKSHFNFLL